jgi:hypothetical protein
MLDPSELQKVLTDPMDYEFATDVLPRTAGPPQEWRWVSRLAWTAGRAALVAPRRQTTQSPRTTERNGVVDYARHRRGKTGREFDHE